MRYFLIGVLVLLVALFVWLLSQDTREADKKEEEKNKRNEAEKAGKKAVNSAKRQCFEAYRQQLVEERNLGLCKDMFVNDAGFRYISEFMAFKLRTEEHRLMSYEYKQQLAVTVLDPLNAALKRFCNYKDGEYSLPDTFDMFLTPEEYYDQQLSYRGTAAIYQTDLEFWQERLMLTQKRRAKLKEDKANAFWWDLFEAMKPFFEEMQVKYRVEIDEAASREAALLYTKDLAERIEQELFRKGISVTRYYAATPKEREKYFRTDPKGVDRPAIVREADGICFEKGVVTSTKIV